MITSGYPPIANSREVAATTAGIARKLDPEAQLLAPQLQGGGNLNGSQNQAHLMGQAGTNGSKGQVPRALKQSASNYCGVT